jgi:ABC-type Zn2+ transport system substrate-binding protein/surface adhesin
VPVPKLTARLASERFGAKLPCDDEDDEDDEDDDEDDDDEDDDDDDDEDDDDEDDADDDEDDRGIAVIPQSSCALAPCVIGNACDDTNRHGNEAAWLG